MDFPGNFGFIRKHCVTLFVGQTFFLDVQKKVAHMLYETLASLPSSPGIGLMSSIDRIDYKHQALLIGLLG